MQNYEKENEADFCQENLVELSPIFNSENKLGESLDFLYITSSKISQFRIHTYSKWVLRTFIWIPT